MVDSQKHSCQKWITKLSFSSSIFYFKNKNMDKNKNKLFFVFLLGMVVAVCIPVLPKLGYLLLTTFHPGSFISSADRFSDKLVRLYTSDMIFNPIYSKMPVKRKIESVSTRDMASEAEASLHIARELVNKNKVEKALKLFKHALALMPNHADILTEYGELLEKHQHDILEAEHLYSQALTYSPEHSRALANRKRTLPLVEEIDQNNFNMIDKKRDILMKIPENHPGLRRMKKESYYSHIYHTTGLEGNTFTLGETRSLVETRLAIGGKSVVEHNEILGLDAALSFVNSTLVHRIGAITLQDILEIHKRVMGHVDPLEAGKIRDTQVFVADFVPPHANEVEKLMIEFVEWLNAEETFELHAIEHAALAHYRFVIIHPFYDGNGRTSRLLMNLILMQAGYPPVAIKKEEKSEYYRHLDTANKGDIRPFIRFIAKCTDQTLNEFLMASTDLVETNINFSHKHSEDDGRTIILEDFSDDSDTVHLEDGDNT